MEKKQQSVLLLDADTVQASSMARAFHDMHWTVIGFITQKISFGNFSRFIDKKIFAPSVITNSNEYSSFFFHFLQEYKPSLIVPLYNDSAFFLSQNKKKIEEKFGISCAIETEQQFLRACNKNTLMNICYENNIPHPRTKAISSLTDLKDIADYVGFPALIKPDISAGSKGILRVDSFEALSKVIAGHIQIYGHCSLQEFVESPGFYFTTMAYRNQDGALSEFCTLKILRYFPIQGGTSCFAQSVTLPDLNILCGKVLEILDWHGFADFDILVDTKGNYKIIEINPRIPSSIHGAYISGINYASIMISDFFKKERVLISPHFGCFLRYIGLDIMWFLFSPNRFKFHPSFFHFFDKNTYSQEGGIHDPFVVLGGILSGIMKYTNSDFRKAKLNKKA